MSLANEPEADTLTPMASKHVNAPHQAVRLTQLGALRIVDKKAWVATVERAMEAAGGYRGAAAEILGISVRQLIRWLSDPDLKDAKRAPPGKPPSNHQAGVVKRSRRRGGSR